MSDEKKDAKPEKEQPKEQPKKEEKPPVPQGPPGTEGQVGCIVFGNSLDPDFWMKQAEKEGFAVVNKGSYAEIYKKKAEKK